MGIPGMVLARFVPLGVKEPEFTVEEAEELVGVAAFAAIGGLFTAAVSAARRGVSAEARASEPATGFTP